MAQGIRGLPDDDLASCCSTNSVSRVASAHPSPVSSSKISSDRILKSAHNVIYPLIDERLRSEDKHLDLLQFLTLTSESIDKPALTLRLRAGAH